MKSFRATCELTLFTIAAVYLQETEGGDGFRRCYNTSVNMHCFDVQYTSDNQLLITSFDNARRRCNDLISTLFIIKDEETQLLVQQFFEESNNPVRSQYVWMDAYRVNDYNNTYTWHWVDSRLPTIQALNVAFPYGPGSDWYVAALEFKDNSFRLTAQQPHLSNRYVCEYPVSNCSSISSNNVRQFDGRCYVASNDQASWYEARNMCLKRGGDLASFLNVTSINFTSWLGSDPNIRYGIGLQFTWYIWIDTGGKVTYAKWIKNDNGWTLPCLMIWKSFTPSFSWYPADCNLYPVYAVCHTVTSNIPTTTSVTTVTTITTITTSILTSSESSQNNSGQPIKKSSESRTPTNIEIGVGVGVGVGVPVLVTCIVIVICVVVRKRRHGTISSAQSTTHQHQESSVDEPHGPTGKKENEIGESAYGIVVPSTLSRQAAEAAEANSAREPTEYAPLQFL